MRLIDYVNWYSGSLDDMEIIKRFLVENDLEGEAISMISYLSESKIDKQRREIDRIKSRVHEMSICSYVAVYEPKLADLLQRANVLLSIDYDITRSVNLMKDLREEVPKHKISFYLNKDLHEFLRKNGIYFKGESHDE